MNILQALTILRDSQEIEGSKHYAQGVQDAITIVMKTEEYKEAFKK